MFITALIVFVISFLFLLMGSVLFYSLSNLPAESGSNKELLNFSVVVSARNEEKNIAALLESLVKLNYPTEKFEIIIVDDNSTDRTAQIISDFSVSHKNIKLIQSDSSHFGKKESLTTGIQSAIFENIIITDADCKVLPEWLNCFSEKLMNKDIVFGIAPLIQKSGVINKIICFENLRSHILVFGSANIGLPYSASARSLAFKKSAFQKVGGYNNTNETLSGDDDLLIRQAAKNNLSLGFITSPGAFVYSDTKESLNEYLRQKARHTSTSHYYLFRHKILLGLWHSVNIICVISFLLSFLNSIFVLPIIIKSTVDYLITNTFQNKFGYKFNTIEQFVLQLIYEAFIIINFVNSFRFKNRWS